MAKNQKWRGKSARNGNSQSPWRKYDKSEFQYSGAYYAWKYALIGNRAYDPVNKGKARNGKRRKKK